MDYALRPLFFILFGGVHLLIRKNVFSWVTQIVIKSTLVEIY